MCPSQTDKNGRLKGKQIWLELESNPRLREATVQHQNRDVVVFAPTVLFQPDITSFCPAKAIFYKPCQLILSNFDTSNLKTEGS